MTGRGNRFTIVVVAFILASCSSGNSTDTQEEASSSTVGVVGDEAVAAWCDLQQTPFELDPADPASVEAGFTQNLAFDLLRLEKAPTQIADDLQVLVAETERIVGVLESNGWDLLGEAVQSQVDVPSEAQRAIDAVYRFEVDECGRADDRDREQG